MPLKLALALCLPAAALAAAAASDLPGDDLEDLQAELDSLRGEILVLRSRAMAQRHLSAPAPTPTPTPEVTTFPAESIDAFWLVLCGALVMFMHAGFALLETGCCRAKNASNVLMKNLMNVCVGTVAWWMFGWSFAYESPNGGDGYSAGGFLSTDESGNIIPTAAPLNWFFQWAFCTAAATIVSGGVAERVQSHTYAAYAFVMAAFIYPVVVAWTWGYGWISDLWGVGYIDFAGSGIVHLTGGVSALAGAAVLGPRKGRFEKETMQEFEAHSLPLVVLGTLSLWFGWYGFNCGSTLAISSAERGLMAAHVAVNTTLAAACGGVAVFVLRYVFTRLYDVGALCNGILAGLVSITAGCGNVEFGSAAAIGAAGGVVYQLSSMLLFRLKIDDPVDASAVHGACGIWGVLAAALFDWGRGFDHFHGWSGFSCMTDEDGKCSEGIWGKVFAVQLVLIAMVIVWAGSLSTLTFLALKLTGLLRVDEKTEAVGMDVAKHSPRKAYAMVAGREQKADDGPLSRDPSELDKPPKFENPPPEGEKATTRASTASTRRTVCL